MTDITLSKTETACLAKAAEGGGLLAFASHLKPVTRERMLARFLQDGLVLAEADAHQLTPAGYRAVGLRPPRRARRVETAPGAITASAGTVADRPLAGKRLVVDLLQRPDGASLTELVSATGWLPHTTRAAICRLRQAGHAVTKSPRPDGGNAYRIAPAPTARRDRSRTTALAA